MCNAESNRVNNVFLCVFVKQSWLYGPLFIIYHQSTVMLKLDIYTTVTLNILGLLLAKNINPKRCKQLR